MLFDPLYCSRVGLLGLYNRHQILPVYTQLPRFEPITILKKQTKTRGVCTDVKLISNTTVERSRDKLLRLYSNIHGFYLFLFTQSTRSPQHPSTECLGFSTYRYSRIRIPKYTWEYHQYFLLFSPQQLHPAEKRYSYIPEIGDSWAL